MYNNYSKLQQTYVDCNCQNCDKYRKFKTQEKCPKQTREDYREQFGSFFYFSRRKRTTWWVL